MLILYYLLWIVFNGRVTPEILLIGLPVCGALYGFSCRFLDVSPAEELRLVKKLPAVLKYLFFLLKEILVSALNVMKLIWSPSHRIHPELKQFRTGLEREISNVVLANSITLTPGTITVHAEGDQLTVHCLDTSTGEGIEDNDMLHRVKELEGHN